MSEQRIRFTDDKQGFVPVKSVGQAFSFGGDSYFALLTRPWWQFFLAVAAYVLTINTLFAGLYLAEPGSITNAREGSFEDAFFFSVQTFATIGYGVWTPHTRFAHVVVTIESLIGILTVGSLAGIGFARLSRPKARILFGDKCVVRNRNGVPHLHMRLANWRRNLVIEASLRVFALLPETTLEGETFRRPVELKLVRSSTPVFFLTWMAMHPIDEESPFYGENALEKLRDMKAQIYLMVTGFDQSLGQVVHAYREYKLEDIVQNARFADVITVTETNERIIDFSRFHEVEPLPDVDAGR